MKEDRFTSYLVYSTSGIIMGKTKTTNKASSLIALRKQKKLESAFHYKMRPIKNVNGVRNFK